MNQAQRRQAVEQYMAEKRRFFGIEDPGPCLGLLRDIGLDVDDPPTPPDTAVAQPLAAYPEARLTAPQMAERLRRLRAASLRCAPGSGRGSASRPTQGGQAAAVATESSEEGDSDEHLSDDEDVRWKQTWRGGTNARDGVPSGSAGRGPLSDDESEDAQEASLTSSPAAAASRRS
eukprot:9426288-Pyramimonas_sp.AAC.1